MVNTIKMSISVRLRGEPKLTNQSPVLAMPAALSG